MENYKGIFYEIFTDDKQTNFCCCDSQHLTVVIVNQSYRKIDHSISLTILLLTILVLLLVIYQTIPSK